MGITVKSLATGAFKNNKGLSTAKTWGDLTGTLGTGDAFPYLSIGKKQTMSKAEDESITSLAYPDLPILTGKYVESELSRYLSYRNMGRFWYWLFGYEGLCTAVAVCDCSTDITSAVYGDTYRDGSNNDFTFIRYEGRSGSNYRGVFRADDTVVPAGATLTKQAGTGPASVTIAAQSALLYEHILELDDKSRHLVDYTAAEISALTGQGYASGAKKNRMADIGIKLGPNDYIYRNSMCKGFTLKSEAGKIATLDAKFCGYSEQRGDLTSSGWTYPTYGVDSDYDVVHHQTMVEIGASVGALTTLGVLDWEVGVDIPLQVMQDTLSGLYLAEPVMEGKYKIDYSFTVSRHSEDTWEAARDNWTSMVSRISSILGYEKVQLFLEPAKMNEASPDDSGVAKQPLKLSPGYNSASVWSTYIGGHYTSLKNSPVKLLVRDAYATNNMFTI